MLFRSTTVLNQINLAVSNYGRQDPPEDIGIESFEFWCPLRRPEGKNVSFSLTPHLGIYSTDLLKNAETRPVGATNAWVAALDDKVPSLTLEWDEPKTISSITLFFDTDYDQAMETVQMGHYDNVMPYCVRNYSIADDKGNVIARCDDNHLAMNVIKLTEPVTTARLRIDMQHPAENIPASLFHIVIK